MRIVFFALFMAVSFLFGCVDHGRNVNTKDGGLNRRTAPGLRWNTTAGKTIRYRVTRVTKGENSELARSTEEFTLKMLAGDMVRVVTSQGDLGVFHMASSGAITDSRGIPADPRLDVFGLLPSPSPSKVNSWSVVLPVEAEASRDPERLVIQSKIDVERDSGAVSVYRFVVRTRFVPNNALIKALVSVFGVQPAKAAVAAASLGEYRVFASGSFVFDEKRGELVRAAYISLVWPDSVSDPGLIGSRFPRVETTVVRL